MVRKWDRKFNEGRSNVNDIVRSDHLSVVNDAIVTNVD